MHYESKINEIADSKHNVYIYNGIKDISIKTDGEKQKITLSHYPMVTWNCSHFGAWQLYGHHHHDYSGDFKYIKDYVPSMGKQYNVSVDLHNFKPVSYEKIQEAMKIKPDNWDLLNIKKKK